MVSRSYPPIPEYLKPNTPKKKGLLGCLSCLGCAGIAVVFMLFITLIGFLSGAKSKSDKVVPLFSSASAIPSATASISPTATPTASHTPIHSPSPTKTAIPATVKPSNVTLPPASAAKTPKQTLAPTAETSSEQAPAVSEAQREEPASVAPVQQEQVAPPVAPVAPLQQQAPVQQEEVAPPVAPVAPLQQEAPVQQAPATRHWKNCAEANAAGRYSIRSTDPDYSASLDRDKDGLACEPKPKNR